MVHFVLISNHKIQVCPVLVVAENAVRKLQMSFPYGQSINNETQEFFQAYVARSFAVEECFVFTEETDAEVMFIIPHSHVTHVAILTMFDRSG